MSVSLHACTHNDRRAVEWKLAGNIPHPGKGVAGPVAGIHNNMLLVAGGSNFPDSMPWLGGKKRYYSDGSVFRKEQQDSLVYDTSFHLPFNLAYAACCSTPAGIVAAGGENETGPGNKVLLITWNKPGNAGITYLPDLPFPVTNAAITCSNNKVYLAGGESGSRVSDNFLVLDLADTAAGWKRLPNLPQPVSHALLIVQFNGADNCIYLVGGRKRKADGISDLYAHTFEFNLIKEQWSQKKSLPYALSAGTGVAAGNHSIVLFGGDKGETFHQAETIIAAIQAEKDTIRKQQLLAERAALQASHPGFSKEILLYNTREDNWTIIGSMPFDTPVTTTAIQDGNEIFIPAGEIKAGVRTPRILSAKIHLR